MGAVIEENGIGQHIRYGHRITRCSFSSRDNLWTLEAVRAADAATVTFTCNFLWMCQGYYDHERPYILPGDRSGRSLGGRVLPQPGRDHRGRRHGEHHRQRPERRLEQYREVYLGYPSRTRHLSNRITWSVAAARRQFV